MTISLRLKIWRTQFSMWRSLRGVARRDPPENMRPTVLKSGDQIVIPCVGPRLPGYGLFYTVRCLSGCYNSTTGYQEWIIDHDAPLSGSSVVSEGQPGVYLVTPLSEIKP